MVWLRNITSCTTVADRLPYFFYLIVTNGKLAAVGVLIVYLLFVLCWLPFWLCTFFIGEWGVYLLAIATGFFVGRSIIRLIAFPGASQTTVSSVEHEFAKYSSRMLVVACQTWIDLLQELLATTEKVFTRKRAQIYHNRVFGVYLEVLSTLYQQPSTESSSNNFTPYGNNSLRGDIGNLSGLTPQARDDGRELLDRLLRVSTQIQTLEHSAHGVLQARKGPLTGEARAMAQELNKELAELRDFCGALKPSSTDESEEDEEDLSVNAVRRRFEDNKKSISETISGAFSSFLAMIDPPPHTSIFGFDVQRGCMLSRYQGARQIWIRRPRGGKLDVLHFPPPKGSSRKAVLYCNPNAGLIEVACGMSLVGGNVPSADGEDAGENSWVDYYTQCGFDVYVFNYAGYGRSFGTTLCASGRHADEVYSPGILSRLIRIFRSTFLTFQPTPDTLRADGLAVAHYLLNDCGVEQLLIHGESIGGMAASATAKYLTLSPATSPKLKLLLCDRTFCNLEAVAQRLVGGWSGYAIRILAPFWDTDVAGDFLAAQCPKVVATDSADTIISDTASLKSGIALWKEIRRGIASTKGIGWITEAPLQYRMADWENVCVNESKYVAGAVLFRAQAPVWPNDKHITVEEAFHFAACCKRIGKVAKKSSRQTTADEEEGSGIEFNGTNGASSTGGPLIVDLWKVLACCDGLCGAPLGVSVKGGFDATVAWLCSCLVFGGQAVVTRAAQRGSDAISVIPSDFDGRPPSYEQHELQGIWHPKPIPEVAERMMHFMESGDDSLVQVSHELQYALGMLQYIQARLSAASTVEAVRRCLQLDVSCDVGMFLNLHCGHNNAFSAQEKQSLKFILEQTTR